MKIPPICLGLTLLSAAASAGEAPPKPEYEPSTNYTQQDVRGWTVFVNHRLLEDEKELGERALELLGVKLYDVNRAVPSDAMEKLHRVPIWLEFQDRGFLCACYHPSKRWLRDNGYNPQKAGSVEIANAATFLKWTHEQPAMVLHELAHAYHHRFLGGYDNPEIAAAYERALKSKSYESVLRWSGKMDRAYALNNPQEYFAELTEALYGTNDFYPFVRAEFLRHDPQGAELLKELWGEVSP